jgi:hypothetical protein
LQWNGRGHETCCASAGSAHASAKLQLFSELTAGKRGALTHTDSDSGATTLVRDVAHLASLYDEDVDDDGALAQEVMLRVVRTADAPASLAEWEFRGSGGGAHAFAASLAAFFRELPAGAEEVPDMKAVPLLPFFAAGLAPVPPHRRAAHAVHYTLRDVVLDVLCKQC